MEAAKRILEGIIDKAKEEIQKKAIQSIQGELCRVKLVDLIIASYY